ncbi:MAG: DUF4838 domain-containing protein [Phycisphaerae bacterium]|nr:DUF4838 domain-containing protein [Phycisphaerae bacterium]
MRSIVIGTTILVVVLGAEGRSESGGWNAWRNSLAPKGEPGPELVLTDGGKTDYAIVVAKTATTQDKKAAEDLALWLKEMTGATFPIVEDDEVADRKVISIGRTRYVTEQDAKIIDEKLGDEGVAIIARDGQLILLGGATRGIINAVYALLEEDLGCRFYTAKVKRIPHRPTLRFRPVPRSHTPRLRIRDPFYKVAFDGTWSLRNRTNAPGAVVPQEWGGHVDYALFVHTYHTLVPPSKYFKDHPEYFMLDGNGKRNPHQLCETNPEVLRIATQSVLDIMKGKPHSEIISVSKTDGGQTCQCPTCKALNAKEGSDAASLLTLVNGVAEAVEKVHPKLIVSTLAYLETVKPPKTIRPRKNVAIRLCTDRCMWAYPFTPAEESPIFSEAMTSWSKIHDRIHIWDYVVNFSHYTAPMPNMDVVAKNIRYFVAHNATGVMPQGAYQSAGAERDLMRVWVMAKLMWDPSLDVRELMQDFIWGYYGQAAPAIAEYDELLRKTAAEHAETMKAPKGGIRYEMDDPFLSKAFLGQATAVFDRAEKLAESAAIRDRVEEARMPIMYVKLCRGPAFVGEGYSGLIDRFEKVARRVGLTHIYEGPPDFEKKLEGWREAAKSKQ